MQGEYEDMLRAAQYILSQDPHHPKGLYYMLLASCGLRDAATARKYAPLVTPDLRTLAQKTVCDSIDLDK